MNPTWKPLTERDPVQTPEDRIPYTREVTPAVVDFREAQRRKRDAIQQARMDAVTDELELRARLYSPTPDDAA